MPRPEFPKTVVEFQQRFATEEACRQYLFQCRWPDGFVCPRCACRECFRHGQRKLAQCKACGYQASVTAGAVMHRTRTPLTTWFWAAFLVSTHTPGFSAAQWQRYAGIRNYKVAFHLLHKLRAAMVRPDRERLRGRVEVDETYIGGPKEGKRGRGAAGKTLVVGALEVLDEGQRQERVGRLRLRRIPDASAASLHGFIRDMVEPGALLRTDDWTGYQGLSGQKYVHEVVGPRESDHVHRTLGNLKTWLKGTHHGVSPKHLQAYLNEFVFRHNRRRTPMAAFQTVLGLASHATAPTYRQLHDAGAACGWTHPNLLGHSESRA